LQQGWLGQGKDGGLVKVVEKQIQFVDPLLIPYCLGV